MVRPVPLPLESRSPWHIYCINPIDFGWNYLPTIGEALCKIEKESEPGSHEIAGFIKNLHDVLSGARLWHWEGDFRPEGLPRVIWLPAENDVRYGFAWKHDNNGDTFVAMPFPVPYYKEIGLEMMLSCPPLISRGDSFKF